MQGGSPVFAIVVLLFAGAILAAVVGALLLLSDERARNDPTDMRYRYQRRR
jgi:hypothetical protein